MIINNWYVAALVEETDWGVRIPQTYSVTPTAASQTAVNAPQAEERRTQSEVLIEISVIGMIQKNTQLMASGYDQVIDHVEPLLTPASQSNELFVATDGPEKAKRDKAACLDRQLGRIDVRRMRLDRVLVIPAPARGDGGSWVHDTVPLLGD